MPTRDMRTWQTGIGRVVSNETEEDILVRGQPIGDLVGKLSFAGMMYLIFSGRMPSEAQARVIDALLVASIEHGIAPPSMIARCFASYGTTIQAAVAAGVASFGDRMGGLGEQLARLMVERLGAPGNDPGALSEDRLRAEASRLVDDLANAGERVPGYGIPLHGADPRVPCVLDVARREGVFGPYCRFGELLGEALAEKLGGRAVPMNLDGVGAAVILDLGLDWRATRIFLITPRTVSMAAHFLEEQDQNTTWRHVPADWIDGD